jgi:NAD+ synthase
MKKLANEIVTWLEDYAEKSGRKSWVVGVSGGVDSGLVSTLCAMTGLPTHCVILPCQSKPEHSEAGEAHISWLQSNFKTINRHLIDLTSTFNAFMRTLPPDVGNNELAFANAKSRLRMIALYQVATVYGGLVVGTGNKIEDFTIFFYTKYGDGAVDISPIANLTKTEVRQMCRELNVIPEISEAVPTDGLWEDGRTDEQAIGASYEELEWVVSFLELTGGYPTQETIDGHMTPRQREILNVYNKWHNAGKHKSLPIPTFKRK